MRKTRLTNCAWMDNQGRLHISVPEMLKELGVPDTPHNRQKYCQLAADHLAVLLKDRPATIHTTE